MVSTTITKEILSGSNNGRNILITVTGTIGTMATSGTLIHTATATPGQVDEVWVYATNVSGTTINLALQWGGIVTPADIIPVGIPSTQGEVLIIPGFLANNGVSILAFASTVSGINVNGYVNRITTSA